MLNFWKVCCRCSNCTISEFVNHSSVFQGPYNTYYQYLSFPNATVTLHFGACWSAALKYGEAESNVALHQYFWHFSWLHAPSQQGLNVCCEQTLLKKKKKNLSQWQRQSWRSGDVGLCHVYADQQNAMAIGHQVTVVNKKKKKKLDSVDKHDAAQIQWPWTPIHNVYHKFVYCHSQDRYTLAMPESERLLVCCQVHTQNTGMTVLTLVGQFACNELKPYSLNMEQCIVSMTVAFCLALWCQWLSATYRLPNYSIETSSILQ